MANGSFTEALRLVRHMENDLFPDVRKWFNALFTNNGLELSKFAEDWSKAGREQQKNFLQYTIQLLEQTIRVRYMPQVQPPLSAEEIAFVTKLAAQAIGFEVIHTMISSISRTAYFIERNAHAKTVLHALSIQLVYAIQGKALPAEML